MKLRCLASIVLLACTHTAGRPASQSLTAALQHIARIGILPLTNRQIHDAFGPSDRSRLQSTTPEVDGAPVQELTWSDESNVCYAHFAVASRQRLEVHEFWFRCWAKSRAEAADLMLRWVGILDGHLRSEVAQKVGANSREFYDEEPRALVGGRISLIAAIRNDERGWLAQLQVRLGDLPAGVTYSGDNESEWSLLAPGIPVQACMNGCNQKGQNYKDCTAYEIESRHQVRGDTRRRREMRR